MVNTVLDRLESLRKRNEKNKSAINKDLYRLLCNKELLIVSYNSIKSNPGNMTPGTDNKTLDGFSDELVEQITSELKNQSFKFKPVRRIFIPKSNSEKLRPLGVPSPRDKVVQKAMLLILESIYEPTFSDNSHGFRPSKSCHTALKQIRSTWSGMKWAIEGDIKGCYDNVDHHILIKLLRKKIQDERFIQLVWKLLRAGMQIDKQYINTEVGTPQGGILSPLLANIYLNELDSFMQLLMDQINSDLPRRPNAQYKRLEAKTNRLRKKYRENKIYADETLEDIKIRLKIIEAEKRILPSKDPLDTKYKKIKYVRYADDWIIGIIGPKTFAEQIKNLVENFLDSQLKMTLSPDKTNITHFPSRKAKFLSYEIQIGRKSGYTPTSKQNRRSAGWQPRLFIPTDKIIRKLTEKNFCKNGKGIKKKGWIVYPDEIITQRYNAILRGIRNYYSPADNYNTSIARIQYILKFSWAHTLGSKHRTKISTQLKKLEQLKLQIERPLTNNIWNFKISTKEPFIGLQVSPRRTKLIASKECKICGSQDKLEMHHLKALKKDAILLQDRYMAALMQRMNRKQLCVCKNCHIQIHKGTYDGISLNYLYKQNKN